MCLWTGVLRCSAERDKVDQKEQMTFPARSSEGPVWTGVYPAAIPPLLYATWVGTSHSLSMHDEAVQVLECAPVRR
jgi:hypothetical protein